MEQLSEDFKSDHFVLAVLLL